jgi:hypothetical protein
MKTEPVEEFCKNDAAPLVRECPDCIDKFIFLAKQYEAENVKLREAVLAAMKFMESKAPRNFRQMRTYGLLADALITKLNLKAEQVTE